MILPVVLRDAARMDFDEAFDWYERQHPGLGVIFAERVRDVLARIGRMPQVDAVIHQEVRHARVPKFPYAIYYQVETTQVVVVGITHDKRNPSIWQSRV